MSGHYGSITEAAVMNFQRKTAFPPTALRAQRRWPNRKR
ncbi:MAG: peptidoglycan-binding domain-containing protein [Christensenellales bacterium]